MNNSKRGFILVIILSVILVLVIGAGMIKEKRDNNKSMEEYTRYIEETGSKEADEKENAEEQLDSSKIKGFINKIKTKQDVKVLMLGDDMAMSVGKTSDAGIWSDGVKNLIETTYGSKVSLTVLAKEGATTETGVAATKENDISGYDLVILCYGNNDSKQSIKTSAVKENYTNIVGNIKAKSPDALMISILESSLELNNAYRLAIVEVATNNSLIKADMREAFNSSGKKESSLAKNGFPNDTGYQLYTQTIGKKIKEAME